jgi:glycerol-3-phosphate acyltransferase PlsY
MIPLPMVLLVIAAYFVGAIPFGYIVGKLKGRDIRKEGSGNIGATNVGRIFGRKYFWIVFSLDALKGMIPMLIGAAMLSSFPEDTWKYVLWMSAAFGALAGHMFPIYLGFKGGKGVATSLGVMFGVFPYYFVAAIPSVLAFLITFRMTRIISISSILGSATFPVSLFIAGFYFNWHLLGVRWPLLAMATGVASLVIYRHRANMSRLLAGTEPKYAPKSS